MITEFRLILTATFVDSAKRDAAYTSLRTALANYATAHAGDMKRADMTRDDYMIPEAPATEKVV